MKINIPEYQRFVSILPTTCLKINVRQRRNFSVYYIRHFQKFAVIQVLNDLKTRFLI